MGVGEMEVHPVFVLSYKNLLMINCSTCVLFVFQV
jgi:hypothetical protein